MSSTRVGTQRATMHRSFSRGTSGGNSSENLPPRTLHRLAREIQDLQKGPPEGVRLVVDAETGMPSSLGEIVAEIEGPVDTPYESKYFQLKLVLSSDFPASPPRGHFLTKIYHPNVDPTTGAICVNTLKKDWTAETSFSHVLSVIRCLLIVPFPESSLNDEAGKLFMESYNEYSKRAKLMANIHGRPKPCDQFEKKDGEETKEGALSRSTNALSNGNNNNDRSLKAVNRSGGSNNNSSNKSGGGGATSKGTDKKTKKKSLKRL